MTTDSACCSTCGHPVGCSCLELVNTKAKLANRLALAAWLFDRIESGTDETDAALAWGEDYFTANTDPDGYAHEPLEPIEPEDVVGHSAPVDPPVAEPDTWRDE